MLKKEGRGRLILALFIGVALIVMLPMTSTAGDLPGKGISVQPMGTATASNQFAHIVAEIALQKMGYTVEPYKSGSVPTYHMAIGQGDADYCLHHWNPLHEAFYQKSGGPDKIVRFDGMVTQAMQGYLIDKKTADQYNIKNLSQFKDPKIAALFDTDGDGKANLTGANPGWGAERMIEHHLDVYELRDHINHDQGSYFALIADTVARYKHGEPVFFYTWTPLWVAFVLQPGKQSEWLEVPFYSSPDGKTDLSTKLPDGRNVGFAVNEIAAIGNRKFIEANPAIRKLFEQMRFPIAQINKVALLIQDGEKQPEDLRRHATDWIKENQATFDGWVEQSLAAAK